MPSKIHTDTLDSEQAPQRGAESVTITIPGTLDAGLSPNGRKHWAAKNRLVQERKSAAYYAARNANVEMWEPEPPLMLHVLVAWEPRRKTMDDDNLWAACKSLRDGIAEAIGVDDKHMVCGSMVQTRDPEKRGYIKVAIEPHAARPAGAEGQG